MKITNYIILFAVVFLLLLVPLSNQVSVYNKITGKQVSYNNNLDTAIDSALEHIVESADGAAFEINYDECVEQFYRSVYASFGATNSDSMQMTLKACVPVLAVVDLDGLVVYHSNVNGDTVTSNWSEKIPFVYSSPSYTVVFHLDNTVKLKILGDSTVYEGDYRQLKALYSTEVAHDKYAVMAQVYDTSCLASEGLYAKTKAQVISNTIMKNLNYYVQQHNRVGQAYGFNYSFHLPESAESEVARGIDGVSFISFFQGYPYGVGTDDVYSKFTISGARVKKTSDFMVRRSTDGYLYYHTKGCKHGKEPSTLYDTKADCASQGAYPCPYCKP